MLKKMHYYYYFYNEKKAFDTDHYRFSPEDFQSSIALNSYTQKYIPEHSIVEEIRNHTSY